MSRLPVICQSVQTCPARGYRLERSCAVARYSMTNTNEVSLKGLYTTAHLGCGTVHYPNQLPGRGVAMKVCNEERYTIAAILKRIKSITCKRSTYTHALHGMKQRIRQQLKKQVRVDPFSARFVVVQYLTPADTYTQLTVRSSLQNIVGHSHTWQASLSFSLSAFVF